VEGIAAGFQKLFLFLLRDPLNDPPYGITSDWNSNTIKVAYNVYKNMVLQLTGSTFKEQVDLLDSSRQNIEDFEGGLNWWFFAAAGMNANASLTASQVHTGSNALQINYQFPGAYAKFGKIAADGSHVTVALNGQPTKVGFWVYGDNNSAIFRILLRDANNQLLQYNVGKAGTKGWHRLKAYLPGPQANQSGSTALAYPLSFQSIQVVRQPDPLEAAFGGTVYLDDFYAESGPNMQDYRFTRPNGKTLDVVWSDNSSGQISIPTLSASAT
jgi:hypothetical protein